MKHLICRWTQSVVFFPKIRALYNRFSKKGRGGLVPIAHHMCSPEFNNFLIGVQRRVLALRSVLAIPALTKAATRGILFEKVFLEISQSSQENTCGKLWRRCLPVNFAKFMWIAFLQKTSWRLLLQLVPTELMLIAYWFNVK